MTDATRPIRRGLQASSLSASLLAIAMFMHPFDVSSSQRPLRHLYYAGLLRQLEGISRKECLFVVV